MPEINHTITIAVGQNASFLSPRVRSGTILLSAVLLAALTMLLFPGRRCSANEPRRVWRRFQRQPYNTEPAGNNGRRPV